LKDIAVADFGLLPNKMQIVRDVYAANSTSEGNHILFRALA
jgi:hypothetical protein